jgi:excisionase family DNA binding protein
MTNAIPDTPIQSPSGTAPSEQDRTVLTVDELAGLLRVERKTAYAAIARGEIPGVRSVGRSIRVSRSARSRSGSGTARTTMTMRYAHLAPASGTEAIRVLDGNIAATEAPSDQKQA